MRSAAIETPRLRLRPLRTRDIPWLRELRADPRVRAMTLEPARGPVFSWLEAYLDARLSRNMLALEEKATGTPVGWILDEEGSVAFELRPAYWNRGFMTEAVRSLLAARPRPAWRGVAFTGNAASRRVLEKCGFRLVASGVCQGHACAYYALDVLPRHDGGMPDLQAALAGGQHLAGIQPALRVE